MEEKGGPKVSGCLAGAEEAKQKFLIVKQGKMVLSTAVGAASGILCSFETSNVSKLNTFFLSPRSLN